MATERTSFFNGLNELRALAALCVLVPHVEQFKSLFGLRGHVFNPLAIHIGQLAVTFFFVLSGFLITYRVLLEKEEHGTVNLRFFYARRVLRIWPLYLLLFFLAFFIFPQLDFLRPGEDIMPLSTVPFTMVPSEDFMASMLLYLFMLPNVAWILGLTVPYFLHTWAIGVEEQFYCIWPAVLKRFELGIRTFAAALALIFGVIFISWAVRNFHSENAGALHRTADLLFQYMRRGRFDSFIIGAMGSYALLAQNEWFLSILCNRYLRYCAYLLTPVFLATGAGIPYFTHTAYAVLFMIIIINVSRTRIKVPVMDYLGRLSYGIYMYHILAIGLCGAIIRPLGLKDGVLLNIAVYSSVICMTIALSAISYHLMEKRFLSMKHRFSRL